MSLPRAKLGRSAVVVLTACSLFAAGAAAAQSPAGPALKLAPGSLPAIAKVDPRFQSYNIEMAEVIGGRFWAPYPKPGEAPAGPQPRP